MKKLLLLTISFIAINAQSQMTEEVAQVQKKWAKINYQTPENKKEQAFKNLAKLATQVVLNNPNNPHALVWEGIIYSTYAGAAGGVGALKIAKHAKNSYEQAIKIDGTALSGSAYTSLGVLYYKMPGWPLSFGSDKKAMKYLKKGLELNPKGIDSNYFFADFLYEEEGEYKLAQKHLIIAKNAEPRSTRPLADKGRLKEISELILKVKKKI
jgi:tetratricopeptide (TPR) repeat protein